jgi:flagellar motor switch protein FliN/FliY
MTDNVKHAALNEVPENMPKGKDSLVKRDLSLVKSAPVDIEVRIGGATITLDKLFELKSGDTLTLDKKIDEPLELVVDGNIVAYGQLVAIDDHFGVQVTQVSE